MTAPLLNMPASNPVTGATGASAPAPGSAAGFQALLAAFFGAPAKGDSTTALLGEAPGDADAPKDDATATDATQTLNADALAFAAQLSAPIPQPQQTVAAPEADTSGAPPTAGRRRLRP